MPQRMSLEERTRIADGSARATECEEQHSESHGYERRDPPSRARDCGSMKRNIGNDKRQHSQPRYHVRTRRPEDKGRCNHDSHGPEQGRGLACAPRDNATEIDDCDAQECKDECDVVEEVADRALGTVEQEAADTGTHHESPKHDTIRTLATVPLRNRNEHDDSENAEGKARKRIHGLCEESSPKVFAVGFAQSDDESLYHGRDGSPARKGGRHSEHDEQPLKVAANTAD